MRIGFDAKRLFNNATGLGNYSRRLIQTIQKFYPEIELHLFTPKVQSAYSSYSELGTVHEATGVKWFWRQWGIQKSLDKSGIQIYHGLSAELPFKVPEGVKTVVTVHDVLYKRFPSFYKWHDRLIYHIKMKQALRNADRIIAISNATRRDLELYYGIEPEAIDVIPVLCQFGTHKPKAIIETGSMEPFILCVSRFEKRKNHINLLKAYSQLEPYERPRLLLLGAMGDAFPAIQNYIRMNGLSDDVIIRPYASESELITLYDTCEFFIFPSLYEGFGMPVVEAMQRSCIVCTSSGTSMEEVSGEYAFLFNPENPEEMAEAMKQALDPELRDSKREVLPAQLARLESGSIVRQYMEVYTGLIGQN